MKHLLIAALVASTFLSPAAHAAVDLDLSAETGKLEAAQSAAFRRGEGRDGAERLLRGGGERRSQQQSQGQNQDQARGNWRGNGGGNRGGWQQPSNQPQAQPQPQPQPRVERWRGREGGVEQPRTEWRGGRENREVRGNGGANDWRRNDRGGSRGGWQQPTSQPQAQPQPQPEAQPDWRNNRNGETWRGGERPRDDRGAGAWLRRHQDNDSNRRRDDNRRDDRYDNGWDRDRGGWDRDDNRRHDDRYGNGWDRDRGGWDRDNRRDDNWRDENRRDSRRWDRDDRRDHWRDNNRRDEYRWDNNWRNDRRYDWRGHRERYRDHYRRPSHYYAPYRNHRYSRFSIGFYIGAPYYEQSYWLNDPWYYRLPQVYGPYRWVRYYDDVLLIDIRNGYVVDVIYDFFW